MDTEYKETRLSLEPIAPGHVFEIELPTTASPTRDASQPGKSAGPGDVDDTNLRARICASAAATYHRVHHSYPRSFLWRLHENDQVLSIRAIDVVNPLGALECPLTLKFRFPNPVRANCVALADPPNHNILSVFVLDQANQLYTLTLRPESFRGHSVKEADAASYCKLQLPTLLKSHTPNRLYALTNDQLIATLSAGGLARYDRVKSASKQNQSLWKETFFTSQKWREVFPKMVFGSAALDPTVVAAGAQTDLGLGDPSFFLTVCLDHRMRIWNVNTGKVLSTLDLLNAERNPNESGKWQIDASQTNLIRIVGETEAKRICVTYSPVGSGEFKFWSLRTRDGTDLEIDDMLPQLPLVPAPPSGSDVWTLADFSVQYRLIDGFQDGIQLWVLWKNNMAYRIQHLSFVLPDNGDVSDLRSRWKSRWSTVIADTPESAADQSGPCESADPAEKWLQKIMAPGRFPTATIEAALSTYLRAIGKTPKPSPRNQSLVESICDAVGSTVTAEHLEAGGLDTEHYRHSTDEQWRRFHRILQMLDKPSGEALALAFEPESDMPWVVCANRISAVRACSSLEATCHRSQNNDPVAALVATGREFMNNFSDGMLQICNSVLISELHLETSKTDLERIQHFSDKTGFWRQVFEDSCTQVTDALGPHFDLVTDRVYTQLLARCNQTTPRGDDWKFPLTEFGRHVVLKAAQDMLELQWTVCFSQIMLLVHMEFDFEDPEDALHKRVDLGHAYRSLLHTMRRMELLRWLANTETPMNPAVEETRKAGTQYWSTALEHTVSDILGADCVSQMPSIIMSLAANLVAPESDIEFSPHTIQWAFLARDRPDLAAELSPLCSPSHFVTYLQGRIHLALGDLLDASACFKRAAYGMSMPWTEGESKYSAGMLRDVDWKYLASGQSRYYAHVASLFDRQRSNSYVVDFARLALQFMNKSTPDHEKLRVDLQGRLFSAAVADSHFELGHATLVAMEDGPVRHSCLKTFVRAMCESMHNAEFVRLPFPGLQNAVDDLLAEHCRQTPDVVTGVPWHQILYAWRISHNDYRGAAATLLDRIQKLRLLGDASSDAPTGDDVLDTAITRQYLMLINVLSCVDHKQAWVTIEGHAAESSLKQAQTQTQGGRASAAAPPGAGKRRVVTLADVRKEYQDELDRIARIQNNQFGFAAGDEMEIL